MIDRVLVMDLRAEIKKIAREEVKKAIEEQIEPKQCINPESLIHTSDIDSMPTVDAVPVVRCRDCAWWDAFPSSSAAPDYHECRRFGWKINITADDFCSRGIQRGGRR